MTLERPSATRAVFTVAACILVGVILSICVLHVWMLDGIDGFVRSELVRDDSRYASGYDPANYRAIRTGNTEDEVRAKLGEPLTIESVPREALGDRVPGSVVAWKYSTGTDNYRQRVVVFDTSGRVLRVVSGFRSNTM